MKKIFTLFVVISAAAMMSAQTPVLGVDYEWKYISESMTAEPTDMVAGVSQTDAENASDDKFADGVIFGDIPAAGGTYTVLDGLWEIQQMTWTQIITGVADWENYYYPARIASSTALEETSDTSSAIKQLINGQLVIVKGENHYNILGSEIQ